jgi:hypothetical protein
MQPYKCVTWSSFDVLVHFKTPSSFNTLLKGVQKSRLPHKISFIHFIFSPKLSIKRRAKHVNLFLARGWHSSNIWGSNMVFYTTTFIPLSMCALLYILDILFHLSSFDFSLAWVFKHLVGPYFVDNLQGVLACHQLSLPITLGGVGCMLLI